MSRLLIGSIDLKKVPKDKLIKGKKGGLYAPVAIWLNDELDQFGNIASIQFGQSKEEREAGEAKIYLGNLKDLNKDKDTSSDNSDALDW